LLETFAHRCTRRRLVNLISVNMFVELISNDPIIIQGSVPSANPVKSLERLVKHVASFLKNPRTRLLKKKKRMLAKRKPKLKRRRVKVM
jgi:hypothetical protein